MTDSKYFKMPVAVHLLLMDGEKVLLLLRQGTGFADGNYSVIAGHLDGDESATEAMRREALEEAGIVISTTDLKFSCTVHRFSPQRESIDIFFTCVKWENNIINKEPNKCGGLHFFPVLSLPENMVDYVREAILRSSRRQPYFEYGWGTRQC